MPEPPQRAQMAGTARRRRGSPCTMRTVRRCPSGSSTAGRRRRCTFTCGAGAARPGQVAGAVCGPVLPAEIAHSQHCPEFLRP
jgi:hypothetical protein